jgi:hypothetical protein
MDAWSGRLKEARGGKFTRYSGLATSFAAKNAVTPALSANGKYSVSFTCRFVFSRKELARSGDLSRLNAMR